jgi:hypothetical protein
VVPIPGFALSALAEIRQQFAGICEECAGHFPWQHCMLSIAAFPSPHVPPSWTSSTPSTSIVSAFRIVIIVALFPGSGK